MRPSRQWSHLKHEKICTTWTGAPSSRKLKSNTRNSWRYFANTHPKTNGSENSRVNRPDFTISQDAGDLRYSSAPNSAFPHSNRSPAFFAKLPIHTTVSLLVLAYLA